MTTTYRRVSILFSALCHAVLIKYFLINTNTFLLIGKLFNERFISTIRRFHKTLIDIFLSSINLSRIRIFQDIRQPMMQIDQRRVSISTDRVPLQFYHDKIIIHGWRNIAIVEILSNSRVSRSRHRRPRRRHRRHRGLSESRRYEDLQSSFCPP